MKVGIITFYNGNRNYGGILQAYALQKTIEGMGHECLQICLDNKIDTPLDFKDKLKFVVKKRRSLYRILMKRLENKKKRRSLDSELSRIESGFINFEESIPHTAKKYTTDNIVELNDLFDAFVCGSDQIWSPDTGGLRDEPHKWNYFLKFAEKKKISYAASFGVDRITDEYRKQIIPLLNRFDAISVREHNAKSFIQSYIDKPVSILVDPVLLVSMEEWKNVAGVEKALDEQYLFSYILGSGKRERAITVSISRYLNCKLVTTPFIGDFTKRDLDFGDYQCVGISPDSFLNYIMNAKAVVTDSFHCAVFSIIFEKQFVVLERADGHKRGTMNSRLIDLLSMVGLNDRKVDDFSQAKETLSKYIDYKSVKKILVDEREKAYSFLEQALKEIY